MTEENNTIIKKAKSTKDTGGASRVALSKRKLITLVAVVVFVGMCALAAYSSYQLYRIKDPAYQQKIADAKNQEVITRVSKLMELPEGTPQVATVADVDMLKKNQPFFEKAMNGDQVLIFTTQAILFRPDTNKIINVGTVNRTEEKSVVEKSQSDTIDTDSAPAPKESKK